MSYNSKETYVPRPPPSNSRITSSEFSDLIKNDQTNFNSLGNVILTTRRSDSAIALSSNQIGGSAWQLDYIPNSLVTGHTVDYTRHWHRIGWMHTYTIPYPIPGTNLTESVLGSSNLEERGGLIFQVEGRSIEFYVRMYKLTLNPSNPYGYSIGSPPADSQLKFVLDSGDIEFQSEVIKFPQTAFTTIKSGETIAFEMFFRSIAPTPNHAAIAPVFLTGFQVVELNPFDADLEIEITP